MCVIFSTTHIMKVSNYSKMLWLAVEPSSLTVYTNYICSTCRTHKFHYFECTSWLCYCIDFCSYVFEKWHPLQNKLAHNLLADIGVCSRGTNLNLGMGFFGFSSWSLDWKNQAAKTNVMYFNYWKVGIKASEHNDPLPSPQDWSVPVCWSLPTLLPS